jgi:uncharacterized membrane protein
MVSSLVGAVLAWLHIFSAIAWMGSAMFLAMVLGPSTRELLPPSRRDLVLRLFPRFIRYVTVFATLTLLFGVLLGLALVSDGSDTLSPSTAWGLRITIGAALALVAYALAMGLGLRSARKILGLVQNARQDQQEAQASDLAKLTTRLRLTAVTVTLLLSVALILMVAAARL